MDNSLVSTTSTLVPFMGNSWEEKELCGCIGMRIVGDFVNRREGFGCGWFGCCSYAAAPASCSRTQAWMTGEACSNGSKVTPFKERLVGPGSG